MPCLSSEIAEAEADACPEVCPNWNPNPVVPDRPDAVEVPVVAGVVLGCLVVVEVVVVPDCTEEVVVVIGVVVVPNCPEGVVVIVRVVCGTTPRIVAVAA